MTEIAVIRASGILSLQQPIPRRLIRVASVWLAWRCRSLRPKVLMYPFTCALVLPPTLVTAVTGWDLALC